MTPHWFFRSGRSPVLFAVILLVTGLVSRAVAQTQVLFFDTLFEAQGLSQFGPGDASGANYSVSMGTSWNESVSFGSFSTGLFGEEWGAGGTASTRGEIGFNAFLSTNGGSVDVYIPNRIRLEAPKDSSVAQVIGITQDRSGLGARDLFQANFASIDFGLGFYASVDARVEGRVAYGFGSASGAITLRDLFSVASPPLYAASRATGIDPFDFSVDLLEFSGSTGTLNLAGMSLDAADGLNKDIYAHDVTLVPGASSKSPLRNRIGQIRIDPILSDLNVHSGSSLGTIADDKSVIGASVDILGLLTASMGLPVNPFDLRAKIPSTPLELQLMALSLNSGIDYGLEQSLSLSPSTYLSLTSNYEVTYLVNGEEITTKNLHYLLPDDASASSLEIVGRPEEEDWQLFSSVYADPKLHNILHLTITGGLDIEALKAHIGAYGAGVGFGPLLDLEPSFTGKFKIFDQIVELSGGTLSRVYRNPIPLFGTGVLQDLQLDQPTDAVTLLSQVGSYGVTDLAGELTLRDSYLINATPLELTGRLHLDVAPSPLAVNPNNPSANQFETPTLTLGPTGIVQVDPNSLLTVTGLKDEEGNDVLDEFGNRQLGFMTGIGHDQGSIDSGTFLLGGTFDYDGAWITRIGADAHIELLPSEFDIGAGTYPDLGRRFSNYRGATSSSEAVDGLSRLDTLNGTLVLAGQDLALAGDLTNSGNLVITGGRTLSAGILTNTATGQIDVDSGSLATFLGLDESNLDPATGTLSNLDLFLGGDAGTTAGVFRYNGNLPTSLDDSISLTLSGDRPALGYVQGGSAGDADALRGITANDGSLWLQNGATQTVGGDGDGLENTGTLTVVGSDSALAVSGSFGNAGTLSLASGGALTASGTLTNLGEDAVLNGGIWNLGGALTYAGPGIAGIGADATVNLAGVGGFFNGGGNAFDELSSLDGSLALSHGAELATSSVLTATGTLDLAAGTVLAVGGFDLHGALNLAGTLRNTGSPLTALASDSQVTVRGAGTLQDADGGNGWTGLSTVHGFLDLAHGGTVRSDADLTFASDSQLILGSGGTLQAAGSSLAFADMTSLQQAGGTLILGGNADTVTTLALPDDFSLDQLTLQLGTGNGTAGALTADGFWTNSASGRIEGAGSISGGTFTNHGSLWAVGGELILSGFTDPIVNVGQFGSYADNRGVGNLVLDGISLHNHGSNVDAFADITLRNSAVITGGDLNVYAGGALIAGDATLDLGEFDVEGNRTAPGILAVGGDMTVLADKTANVNAATTVGVSGSLNLEGEGAGHSAATLAFGSGSSLSNFGTVNLGGGAAIAGVTIENFGTVNLTSGLVHLDNIANSTGGTINLLDGSTLNFNAPTVSNAGLIHLSGENPDLLPNSFSTFLLTQDLTLTGGGTIQLGGYNTSDPATTADVDLATTIWQNAGSGIIVGDGAADYTLTLEDQQIVGRGDFGQGTFSLINRADGGIGVYGEGSVLNIETNSGGFLNEGTLSVDVGSTMNILGGPFLSLDENGHLVKGTYRVGGTLVIPGLSAGAFDSRVGLTFEGSNPRIQNESGETIHIRNNLAGGSLTVTNGSYTFATDADRPFTNQGFLSAGPGGLLAITGDHFTNFDAASQTLSGGTYESAGTFKFDGADIRILDFNTGLAIRKTDRGTGVFVDETGQDALRNFSLNRGTFSLLGGADYAFAPEIDAFTNDGRIRVNEHSTLDLRNAALTNTANADWWVGGTVTGGSGFTTNGKTTLFGPFAQIDAPGYTMDDGTVPLVTVEDGGWTRTSSPVVHNQGHLIFAGGHSATYSDAGFAYGATIHNHGTWEIGSANVENASGDQIRSAGSVQFVGGGAGDYANRIINHNGATVSYYGAMGNDFHSMVYGVPKTSDATTGSFNLDHLRIEGGIFDAAGLISVNADGTFALQNTTLRNSHGRLTVEFATPGSIFNVSGGLDLTHEIRFVNGTINYSNPGGFPVGISGFDLHLPGYMYSDADYSLRNGARFLDADGLSAIRHIQHNDHTVTFERATGIVGQGSLDNSRTYELEFTNRGTMNAIDASVSFGDNFINRGTLHASDGGRFAIDGHLYNYATLNGTVAVGGDLQNLAGGFLAGGGSIGGNLFLGSNGTVALTNDGVSELSGFTVDGYVSNFSDLTLNGSVFRHSNLSDYAPIHNYGNLNLSGHFQNDLHQAGTIHTRGITELAGDNANLGGSIYVDDGKLIAASPNSTGNAAIHLAHGTEFDIGEYARNNNVFATGDVRLAGSGGGFGLLSGSTLETGTLTTSGSLSFSARTFNSLVLDGGHLAVHDTGFGLDLKGPVTGHGTLEFHGIGEGGVVSVFDDLTISNLILNSATGTPWLSLTGNDETQITADIHNPGLTRIAAGSDLTLHRSLYGNGTLEIGDANAPASLTIKGAAELVGTTIHRDATLTIEGRSIDHKTPFTGNVANFGELIFATAGYSYTQPADQIFSGDGLYRKTGSGTLTFLNTSILGLDQPFALDEGAVRFGKGSLNENGSFAATVAAGTTFAFQNAGSASLFLNGYGQFDNLGSGFTTLDLAGGFSGVNHHGSGTLVLSAGNAIDGPVTVGPYHGIAYPGFTNDSVGTLLIADDSSLGAAPNTYAPDQLFLDGATFGLLPGSDPVTLAATRGVTIGNKGATFDINGALTIPNALEGAAGTAIAKTGDGTLTVGASPSFDYAVKLGTLQFDNAGGGATVDASVDLYSTLQLSGGGTYSVTAAPEGIDGRILVDAGTTLQFEGNVNEQPLAGEGELVAHGTVRTFGQDQLIARLTGTGTYEFFGNGNTATINHLNIDNVRISGSGLAIDNIGVNDLALSGVGVLQARSGTVNHLNFNGGTVAIESGGGLFVHGLTDASGSNLMKEGAGTLIFDNAGTLSTIFNVREGTLAGADGTVFSNLIHGAGGFGVFAGGATLGFDNTYSGGTHIYADELTIGTGGTQGSVVGDITLTSGSGVAFNRSDTYTFANTLIGSGHLRQAGSGTLVLDSNLSWTDPDSATTHARRVTVSSGTLRLDDGVAGLGQITNDSALVFNNAASLKLDHEGLLPDYKNITGSGTVTQAGSGVTTLGGLNDWTGATAIDNGTLAFTTDFANVGGVTVASGARLEIAGTANVGGTVANAGTVALNRGADSFLFDATLTGTGTLRQEGTGRIRLHQENVTNHLDIAAGSIGFGTDHGTTQTYSGIISGPGTFFHAGSGTLSLTGGTGTNALGSIRAESGTLRLDGGDWNAPITVDLGASLAIGSAIDYRRTIDGTGWLQVEDGGELNLFGTVGSDIFGTGIAVGGELHLLDGSNYLGGTIANDGLLRFGYNSDFIFDANTSGTGDMLVSRPNRLTLTGEHTGTGTTTIGAGSTLALADGAILSGTIANAGAFELITTPGSSRLVPANITGTGNVTFSGGGTIEVLADGLNYSGDTFLTDGTTLGLFAHEGAATTFAHSIFGNNGNLLKSGAGMLLLTSGNHFNNVTVSAGTLQVGNGSAPDAFLNANDLLVHGTLAFDVTSPATLTTVRGTGTIRQKGSGSVAIVGDNPNFIGETIVDAGSLLILGNESGTAGSVGGKIVADGTLWLRRNGEFALNQGLAGSGNIQKLGTGDLRLAGNVDFSGVVTVGDGGLIADARAGSRLDRIEAASLTNRGDLTITGDNSLDTTNTGRLTLGDGGTSGWLGNGKTIANSGVLEINRSDDVDVGFANTVTGTGTILQKGTGTLTVGMNASANVLDARSGTMVIDPAFNGHSNLSVLAGPDSILQLGYGTHDYSVNVSGLLRANTFGDLTLNRATLTGGIELLGTGTLFLPNANNVNLGGLLSGTGDLALGGNRLNLGGGSTSTGTIRLGDGAFGIVTVGGDLASALRFASPGGTVSFTNADTAHFTGSLTNVSSLNFNGSGETVLQSAIAADTTLNDGRLSVASGGSLDSLTINRGTAALNGGTLNHAFLANAPDARLDLSAGDTTLSTLAGGGTVNLGTRTLTLTPTVATAYAGVIEGTGSLVKSGHQTFALEGDNTFTGNVTVAGGSLFLRGTNAASGYTVGNGASLFLNSAANLGTPSAGPQPDLITLQGGTLGTETSVALDTHHGIALDGGGTLSANGTLTLNSTISGDGTLTIGGGRVLFNSANTYAGPVAVHGTLALGRADAIDPTQTSFASGSTFDLNGFDWSAPLAAQGVTLANSANAPVTVSSALTLTDRFGLSGHGRMHFAGTLQAPGGDGSVSLISDGNVRFDSASGGLIGSVDVGSGNLSVDLDALPHLKNIALGGTGQLTFTGEARDLALAVSVDLPDNGGDTVALLNNTSGAVRLQTDLALTERDNLRRSVVLIGGESDLTLAGSLSGEASLRAC